MLNSTNSVGSEPMCVESCNHIPKTFELMLKIETLAQERLKRIIEDVQAGKITLEEVKRQRGLI